MKNTELIKLLNDELAIDLAEQISYAELHTQLAGYVNLLITTNFEKLIALLYRIDIDERKLKQLLLQFPDQDAGNIIATLLIERQEQKLKSRRDNALRDNNISEEEKW